MKSFVQKLNPFEKKRAYEGASKSKRMKNFHATNRSANSEILNGVETIRNRARYLIRNNPFAARGIQAIVTNVVGRGIHTQFRSDADVDGTNPAEQMWNAWAGSIDFDFDGRYDITGVQRLIMRAVAGDGDVIIRKRFNSKKAFPLQYQILEADFLDTSKNENLPSGNVVTQGIEFNKQGQRVAYWLFEQHPGSYDEIFKGVPLKSNRVDADQVRHIFRQDRPGQARGISWFAPVIVRIKDLDDYEDAQLMRQKIAACFAAFVQDISADVEGDKEDGDDLASRIEPGTIEFLPPGKTVQFANPPELQNYDQYTKNVLRSIAAGLGLSYEVFTGDLSNVSFSSGRMGWIEFDRNIQVWRKDVMFIFLDQVVADFKETAKVLGKDFSKYSTTHMPPKREMIDPTKETAAALDAIRAGLSSWSDELMAQGKDPQEHFKQYQKDLALLDSMGLVLDSDPRKSLNKQNNGGSNEAP